MRLSSYLLMFCLFCLSACQFPIPAMVFVGGEETGLVDGLLTSARFYQITDMAIDSQGNIFVADGGNLYTERHPAIRKITPEGMVSTISGGHGQGHKDGRGSEALFVATKFLALDSKDNIFIVDTTCIRKLEKKGEEYIASTFVGTCYDQRSNAEVGIENPYEYEHYDAELVAAPERGFLGGLGIDSEDNIYATNSVMLKIGPDKKVTVMRNKNNELIIGMPSKIIALPQNKIYMFFSAHRDGEMPTAVFQLDKTDHNFKAIGFPDAIHHNNIFSFVGNSQGYLYMLTQTGVLPYPYGGGYDIFEGFFREKNEPVIQRISPDGKEVKTWPLPEGVSLENAVLDEKRRVIYTGSRRGNQIFKIPLPDGA